MLEHIVDAVIQFEGDRHYLYRILRGIKNRFGNTSEIGIYEMKEDGLKEVTNPSMMLLNESDEALSGSAIGVTVDGARPFLIDTQALVSTAAYGTAPVSYTHLDVYKRQTIYSTTGIIPKRRHIVSRNINEKVRAHLLQGFIFSTKM